MRNHYCTSAIPHCPQLRGVYQTSRKGVRSVRVWFSIYTFSIRLQPEYDQTEGERALGLRHSTRKSRKIPIAIASPSLIPSILSAYQCTPAVVWNAVCVVVPGLPLTYHGTHVARTYPHEKPGGSTIEAVAVESANVPARGGESTVWATPFSDARKSFATVPRGTYRASIATGTAATVFSVTSGIVKLPVGFEATGIPATLTTRTDGQRVDGSTMA